MTDKNAILNLKSFTSYALAAALVAGAAFSPATPAFAKDKKKQQQEVVDEERKVDRKDNRKIWENLDKSKIVWPNPPAITRIKYLDFWSGEKFVEQKKQEKKKQSWMERVAGVTTGETVESKPRWQLVTPNGIAVDSKNRVYIADSKVRAIYVVNMQTGEYEMIKNNTHAKFQWLTGLVMDDGDILFSADSGMKRVLVFDTSFKVVGEIRERLISPGGMAIDKENRLLYVADAETDLVNVYDADPPFKFLRHIGKPGTNHTSTAEGEFAKPTGVAVDKDGNVFVSDTWNNRIQVFDAEGVFIRSFGKPGDGPGYFARPKGISLDSDGQLWVADSVQDRVQVFTPEGKLLIYMGGHGIYPGQFRSLANVFVDQNNRVLTTEQLAGRLQMFQYVTNAEAKAELDRKNDELKKKREEGRKVASTTPAEAPKQ